MKKKILFLITFCNCGGLENYLLRYLTFDSINEKIVCCTGGTTVGELENEYRNVCHQFDAARFNYINPWSWLTFIRYLYHNKPDTICDFHGDFAGFPMMIAWLCGISNRIVGYRQSTNLYRPNIFRTIYSLITNRMVRIFASRIISNSEAGLDFFHPHWRSHREKYIVIRNGVNPAGLETSESKNEIRQSLGIPEDIFLVGNIGRAHPAKNHETILRTASLLNRKNPEIRFLFCGKDIPRQLGTVVEKLGLREQIYLFDFRKDTNRILKALDLFYFPSLTEGQPNALIEAMIAGLPIIASNIDAIKETVPKSFIPDLLPPMAAEMAAKEICHCMTSPEESAHRTCRDWARETYDPKYCFAAFQAYL